MYKTKYPNLKLIGYRNACLTAAICRMSLNRAIELGNQSAINAYKFLLRKALRDMRLLRLMGC